MLAKCLLKCIKLIISDHDFNHSKTVTSPPCAYDIR
jgi:hypothetical protein